MKKKKKKKKKKQKKQKKKKKKKKRSRDCCTFELTVYHYIACSIPRSIVGRLVLLNTSEIEEGTW